MHLEYKDIKVNIRGEYNVVWGSKDYGVGVIRIDNTAQLTGDILLGPSGYKGFRVKASMKGLNCDFSKVDVQIDSGLAWSSLSFPIYF